MSDENGNGNGNGNRVTLAELGRMLARFEKDTGERLDHIEKKFDRYELKEISNERQKIVELRLSHGERKDDEIEKRIEGIETRLTTNFRLGLSGLVFPIVVALVVAAIVRMVP